MLKNEKGYKGIEYGLVDRGNRTWGWTFHPRKGEGPVHRGEVKGTREDAEMACIRAINSWLVSASPWDTPND